MGRRRTRSWCCACGSPVDGGAGTAAGDAEGQGCHVTEAAPAQEGAPPRRPGGPLVAFRHRAVAVLLPSHTSAVCRQAGRQAGRQPRGRVADFPPHPPPPLPSLECCAPAAARSWWCAGSPRPLQQHGSRSGGEGRTVSMGLVAAAGAVAVAVAVAVFTAAGQSAGAVEECPQEPLACRSPAAAGSPVPAHHSPPSPPLAPCHSCPAPTAAALHQQSVTVAIHHQRADLAAATDDDLIPAIDMGGVGGGGRIRQATMQLLDRLQLCLRAAYHACCPSQQPSRRAPHPPHPT